MFLKKSGYIFLLIKRGYERPVPLFSFPNDERKIINFVLFFTTCCLVVIFIWLTLLSRGVGGIVTQQTMWCED